jgi:hypothetical protein
LWARFTDSESATAEWLRMQFRDGSLRFFVRAHFDKGEAARLSGVPIPHHLHALHCPDARKCILQFCLVGLERQIPDK